MKRNNLDRALITSEITRTSERAVASTNPTEAEVGKFMWETASAAWKRTANWPGLYPVMWLRSQRLLVAAVGARESFSVGVTVDDSGSPIFEPREKWLRVIAGPATPSTADRREAEQAAAAKPAAGDPFRVSVGEAVGVRHREQKRQREERAAANRPPEPTPAQAREQLKQIYRGTLMVSDDALRRINRIASQGAKSSASPFDVSTAGTKDRADAARAEAAAEEAKVEGLRGLWYSQGKPFGITFEEFRRGKRHVPEEPA